jgi:hypothetical protein
MRLMLSRKRRNRWHIDEAVDAALRLREKQDAAFHHSDHSKRGHRKHRGLY